MCANSHHAAPKFYTAILAATLLLTVGPPALRTIAEVDIFLAQISLQLCEIGIAVLHVCGI